MDIDHKLELARRIELRAKLDLEKFYTAKGWLTHYAFACSYRELYIMSGIRLSMDLLSSGAFHIEINDRLTNDANYHWYPRTLTEARRKFVAYQRKIARRVAEHAMGLELTPWDK